MASLFPSQAEADAQLDAILKQVAGVQEVALARTGRYDQYCAEIEPARTIYQSVEAPLPEDLDYLHQDGKPWPLSGEVIAVDLPPVMDLWDRYDEFLSGASLQTAVHVYESDVGVGYLVIATVTDGATSWQRVVNVGPESYRKQYWEDRSGGMR